MTPELTEEQWQNQVLELAALYRWMAHHDRPAQDSRGRYMTPIQGDPGFPDLVLVRSGRILFVELKDNRRKLEPNQMAWRDRLLAAGAEWYCWRPRHWPEVKATLALPVYSSWRAEDVDAGGRV